MARRYEDAGGDYRDTGENRNEAKKGAPVKKGDKQGSGNLRMCF